MVKDGEYKYLHPADYIGHEFDWTSTEKLDAKFILVGDKVCEVLNEKRAPKNKSGSFI